MSSIYTEKLDRLIKSNVDASVYDTVQELMEAGHATWTNENYCGDALTLTDQVGDRLMEASVDMDVVLVMETLQIRVNDRVCTD